MLLVNLNLYDLDIQTLTTNAVNGNLNELKKLSFKRSCFMDKIRELDKLLPVLPNLEELNFSCTNLLAQLGSPVEFFNSIEKNRTLKILNVAAVCEDNEDAKKLRFLLRSVRRN